MEAPRQTPGRNIMEDITTPSGMSERTSLDWRTTSILSNSWHQTREMWISHAQLNTSRKLVMVKLMDGQPRHCPPGNLAMHHGLLTGNDIQFNNIHTYNVMALVVALYTGNGRRLLYVACDHLVMNQPFKRITSYKCYINVWSYVSSTFAHTLKKYVICEQVSNIWETFWPYL